MLILEGLTLKQLRSARQALRGGKTPPTAYLGIKKVIALPVERIMTCYSEFAPLAKGDMVPPRYKTVIVFQYLEFQDDQDKKHPAKATIAPGEVQYFALPKENKTRVMVTCNCPDFYWTWWWYVDRYESLAGKRFPHPSKLGYGKVRRDGKKYGHVPGSRNDLRTPGVCKHIIVMANDLKKQKLLKG